MNSKFNIEKNIYFMAIFIALIGLFLIVIRSDRFLEFRYFADSVNAQVLSQSTEKLNELYERPSFLMLVNEDDQSLATSIKGMLERLDKEVIEQPIEEPLSLTANYSGIIIATENLDALSDKELLIEYATSGGSIFFATRPSPGPSLSSLYQQLGIVEIGNFIENNGIELSNSFFDSSFSQSFLSQQIRNSSLAVRLDVKTRLYATASDGTPLLWTVPLGSGKIIVFNGSMFSDSAQGALFIKGVQLMLPTFIYPVMNAKVTALEGFPFPIASGRHEDGVTNEEYYRQNFWPNMERLEAKYDLNYTASYVATFEDDVINFNSNDLSSSQENTGFYARELVRMGGELAIQGYNHFPINRLDEAEILIQMQNAAQRINHALPNYQVQSYIPVKQNTPLDPVATMQQVFPELHAVLTNVDHPTMQDDGVAVLPKTMSGFTSTEFTDWLVFNQLAISGYFSQSILPQTFLTNTSLEADIQDFGAFQKQLKQDVPWLRGMTLSSAAETVKHYTSSHIYEEPTENGITFHLDSLSQPSYFYFSTERSITDTKNCEIQKIGDDLYLVEVNDLTFEIGLDG
jgi:hypothetical protein